MNSSGNPSFKVLLSLSWPTVVTFTGLAVRSLCDVWLAGQLGQNELAALAPAQLIMLLILSFGYGSLFLVNTFASQAIGCGNQREAGHFAWQGIWFSLGYGVVAMLAWPLSGALFRFFGHPEAVAVQEIIYFRSVCFSIGWQMIAFAATNYFFALSRPVVPMLATFAAVAVHLVVGISMVKGVGGSESMGIAGIAWALVASSATLSIFLICWMILDPRCVAFGSRCFSICRSKMTGLLKTGMPLGARDLLDNVVWGVVVIWLIGSFGPVHMASATVILSLNDILMLPCDGIGSGMVALMGRSLGKRDFTEAEHWRTKAMSTVIIYSLIAGGLVFLFRQPFFFALVGTPEVASLCVDLAGFIPLLLALYACYGIYDHALCASGDNAIPTLLNLLLTIIILGAGGWIFLEFFSESKSTGVWSLMAINLFVILLSFILRWKSGRWKAVSLV